MDPVLARRIFGWSLEEVIILMWVTLAKVQFRNVDQGLDILSRFLKRYKNKLILDDFGIPLLFLPKLTWWRFHVLCTLFRKDIAMCTCSVVPGRNSHCLLPGHIFPETGGSGGLTILLSSLCNKPMGSHQSQFAVI